MKGLLQVVLGWLTGTGDKARTSGPSIDQTTHSSVVPTGTATEP